jgi:hypothetical protein
MKAKQRDNRGNRQAGMNVKGGRKEGKREERRPLNHGD